MDASTEILVPQIWTVPGNAQTSAYCDYHQWTKHPHKQSMSYT